MDLTPNTNASDLCGTSGTQVPGNPAATGPYDGSPVCTTGTVLDYNNNQVFRPVRLEHQRLFFGLNYRYEILTFGGQFMMDIVPPEQIQNQDYEKEALKGVPKHWAFALQLGGQF